MIEIIIEKVKMPPLVKLRFKREWKNVGMRSEKWFVVDTHTDKVIYKGSFLDVCLAWHNLNKKYYRDIKNKKNGRKTKNN